MAQTTSTTAVVARQAGLEGLWSWLTTVDHKRIGILYLSTASIFLLIGGLEALLMRLQLVQPDARIIGADAFNQLFTMHGTTMIFLAIMPLSVGFINYVVPLQIGARDVAFPRLNAFSYWAFLFGGLLLYSSFLVGAAPDMGWFGYAPLTERTFAPGQNVDFWLMGVQVLGISSLVGAFNFIVTIINLRAPGMTLMRMPMFTWMTLITSCLIAAAFPPLTVALIFLSFDRFVGTTFFLPGTGADPLLWQHLFWVFGHPEVYIMILPAMGIISEVLPTFARKPLFGYPFMVYSSIAIGFLSFGVWAHHMFAVGMGPLADAVFALSSMTIAVPTGVKIFNWIATLWDGASELRPPQLFGVAFIFMFIIGGISGVMHASPPVDLQQTDTYFVVAHIHYVLFGGSLFALLAGLHYWFPKMSGRLLDEALGRRSFWLILVGANLAFFPMHFSGLLGMPRRIYTYPAELGVTEFNLVSTIGAFVLGLGMLVVVFNVLSSLRVGRVAGNDPWDARSLEWSLSSPPPPYNFAIVPVVTTRDAWWEAKRSADEDLARGEAVATRTNRTPFPGKQTAPAIHLPKPSFWPLVTAAGLTLLAAGFLTMLPVSAIGVVVLVTGILAWSFEPAAG